MNIWHFLIVILLLAQCTNKPDNTKAVQKIRILILSGKNNHEWEKTTPQLVRVYEESEKFHMQVTESPDTLTYEDFRRFHAVVSNWTAWPANDYRWPEAAEKGLLQFIEQGGGFVLFHAASASFYDWPQYQQLIGTTWGDSTKHGKIAPHRIVIKDTDHPITTGMSDFWITDELWVNAGVNAELKVLAESFSDPSNKGRGAMEPVVHIREYGKGKVFHNILGHNVRAMKNTGWKTLMLRGTEWAATGEVTIPVPKSLSDHRNENLTAFSWQESDTTLALLDNGEILWQYNFNTQKGKPFFHPVNLNHSTITWLSPEDHPWHLGLWHSWKYINGVNYWEYDRTEGVAPFNFLGITEVREISIEKHDDFSCQFYLDIFYHEKNGPDLMKEKRTIYVSRPGEDGQFYIDYQMNLTAMVDSVELNRTPLAHQENGKSWGGYAGLSVRFNQDLFDPEFINFGGGSEMEHGKPMPWKYYGFRDIQGHPLGVAIFTNPENLNHPEPWFVTNTEDHPFYFFSPSPIFNQPHTFSKQENLSFGYRIRFYNIKTDIDRLAADYTSYLELK
jgi:type 1 glutamine amidotransferase